METLFNLSLIRDRIRSMNVEPVYITKNSMDDTWHSTMHVHPFTELFYVISGQGRMKFPNREIPLRADDLLIVNSNIFHTEVSDSQESLSYIVLGMKGLSIMPFHKNEDPPSDRPESVYDYLLHSHIFKKNFRNHRDKLLTLFLEIHREQEGEEPFHQEIMKNLLEILIFSILRLAQSKLVLDANTNNNRQLEYIKSYIDLYYTHDITLEELAKMIYTNKYQLVREFKKSYGVTPIHYLLDKRLNIAEDLLKNTNHTIEDITRIVGFNSASYFTQIFKRRVKYTPREYRKRLNNKG